MKDSKYYISTNNNNRSFYDKPIGRYFKECLSSSLPDKEISVAVISENTQEKIYEGSLIDETDNYVLIKKKKI